MGITHLREGKRSGFDGSALEGIVGSIRCIPKGFDLDLARELGNLVAAAYDQFKPPPDRPAKWPLSAPYVLVSEFSATTPKHVVERFGFVATRSDTRNAYVVFRGTVTLGDWLADAEFGHVSQQHGWGNTEHGFTSMYDDCSPAILTALRSLPAFDRVIVTGHSLGGALATLCCADIRATLGATTTLYALAAPRTGDQDFAARFNAECPDTWRIVNTEDLVNNVPLATTAVEELHLHELETLTRDVDRIPLLGPRLARHLTLFQVLFGGEIYEHVGTPVDFTQNNGTLVANHVIATYLTALSAPAGDVSR